MVLLSVLQLFVIANVIHNSLMMEAILTSETPDLRATTWRHIPKDGIFKSIQWFTSGRCHQQPHFKYWLDVGGKPIRTKR
jgi:hypothetical protein